MCRQRACPVPPLCGHLSPLSALSSRPTSLPWPRTTPQTPAEEQQPREAAKPPAPGASETALYFPRLPDSPQGLLSLGSLTPLGGSLSSRLEELRSESLSLSLETAGKETTTQVTPTSPPGKASLLPGPGGTHPHQPLCLGHGNNGLGTGMARFSFLPVKQGVLLQGGWDTGREGSPPLSPPATSMHCPRGLLWQSEASGNGRG